MVVAGADGIARVLLDDRRDYAFPRLSPDGRQLALAIGSADHRDVWLDELRLRNADPADDRGR